mmetsp:Transcript_46352/g.110364  ORF Transcript_46352/g.110364 Transcript_46352/m.110364 type:complete len:597 (-) Transcript_46352:29-1819(-)
MSAASDGSASEDELDSPPPTALPKPPPAAPMPLTTPDSIQRNKEQQARLLEKRLMDGMEALQLDHKKKTDQLHATLNQQKQHVNMLLNNQVQAQERILDERLEEQIRLVKMARKEGFEAASAAAKRQAALRRGQSFDAAQQGLLLPMPQVPTYNLAPVTSFGACNPTGPVLPYVPPPRPLTPAGSFAPSAVSVSYVAPPGSVPATPIGSFVPGVVPALVPSALPVAPAMSTKLTSSSYVAPPGGCLSRTPSHHNGLSAAPSFAGLAPPLLVPPAPQVTAVPVLAPSGVALGVAPPAPVQMTNCSPPQLPAWTRPPQGLAAPLPAPVLPLMPAATQQQAPPLPAPIVAAPVSAPPPAPAVSATAPPPSVAPPTAAAPAPMPVAPVTAAAPAPVQASPSMKPVAGVSPMLHSRSPSVQPGQRAVVYEPLADIKVPLVAAMSPNALPVSSPCPGDPHRLSRSVQSPARSFSVSKTPPQRSSATAMPAQTATSATLARSQSRSSCRSGASLSATIPPASPLPYAAGRSRVVVPAAPGYPLQGMPSGGRPTPVLAVSPSTSSFTAGPGRQSSCAQYNVTPPPIEIAAPTALVSSQNSFKWS